MKMSSVVPVLVILSFDLNVYFSYFLYSAYQVGEVFIPNPSDCSELCSCVGFNEVQCVPNPNPCHADAICGARTDETYGCVCREGYQGDGINSCIRKFFLEMELTHVFVSSFSFLEIC